MHSDWFNGIDTLQGRWQHGEKVEYCYPSGLEKTLCKWEVYVPLVTKGLKNKLLVTKDKYRYNVWHRAVTFGSLETLETLWRWEKEADLN
jgi:hypothetical protein